MEIKDIKNWFEIAIPNPTKEQACVQVGAHAEEFSEAFWALGLDSKAKEIDSIADLFKSCDEQFMWHIEQSCKVELLDSLADQIVIAIGVAHMLGMDIEGALEEVNRSNHSKFENGQAVFDENGKIKKGKNYTGPQLKKFIGK